jgi:hypothetical protein
MNAFVRLSSKIGTKIAMCQDKIVHAPGEQKEAKGDIRIGSTSDEPLAVAKTIHGAKAIIVTTPQELSLADVRKSISFCKTVKMPFFELIENMSGFISPYCEKPWINSVPEAVSEQHLLWISPSRAVSPLIPKW